MKITIDINDNDISKSLSSTELIGTQIPVFDEEKYGDYKEAEITNDTIYFDRGGRILLSHIDIQQIVIKSIVDAIKKELGE